MNCGWSWPTGYHLEGIFFWLILIFATIAALLFFLRHREPVISNAGCPACEGWIHSTYFRCPHCGQTLKSHCPKCSRIVESSWQYCPDCRTKQKHG